jgi:hypothetical protein
MIISKPESGVICPLLEVILHSITRRSTLFDLSHGQRGNM